MEIGLADRNKRSQVRQMVPNMGGAVQDQQMCSQERYILETLEGEEFFSALNGKYLKKYYPSVWVDA